MKKYYYQHCDGCLREIENLDYLLNIFGSPDREHHYIDNILSPSIYILLYLTTHNEKLKRFINKKNSLNNNTISIHVKILFNIKYFASFSFLFSATRKLYMYVFGIREKYGTFKNPFYHYQLLYLKWFFKLFT